jgi:hypothetical protein
MNLKKNLEYFRELYQTAIKAKPTLSKIYALNPYLFLTQKKNFDYFYITYERYLQNQLVFVEKTLLKLK